MSEETFFSSRSARYTHDRLAEEASDEAVERDTVEQSFYSLCEHVLERQGME